MKSTDIDFLAAQSIIKAAYPEYQLRKNGFLVDGVYDMWGEKPKPIGVTSYGSRMAMGHLSSLGIDLGDHLDDSEKDHITKGFEVEKSSGKIVSGRTSGRWNRGHKYVAALTESDVRQIEDEVIATGLCKRDELGRIVTNCEDCYLTLVDGCSVWVSIVPCEDYDIDGWNERAIRPEVEPSAYRVGDGQGGWTEHYWSVHTNARTPKTRSRRHDPKRNPLDRNLPSDEQLPQWAFCIVGNVIDKHLFGKDKIVVYGAKHFRPDAKLYILDGFWGLGGERLTVMGQPRKQRDLIKIVLKRSLIRNFRVKQIYDKRVIRELYLPFGNAELQTDSLKDELMRLAEYWNEAVEAKDNHGSNSGREI